jgi:hypothetical protein
MLDAACRAPPSPNSPRQPHGGWPLPSTAQFFSSFNAAARDSFIWADGVLAFEPEAVKDAGYHMGLGL